MLSSDGKTSVLIHSLCVHLYKSGNSLLRTRAMLCHIYHFALHNDFHTARDMLLMSHLQESIHNADVATQILYNRTVVQLGLSAFRCGLIKEAQATLQDIFATQRVKELLAQGVHQQRYQVLSPEQEKAERQRQLPFHMHINTELLEAAFLVSSMLVEIPLLASIDSEEQKRKAISKPFRRLLDFADRQVFTGPPESTRDHIMQASKALQDGEWEKCRDLIQSIKIWSLMPECNQVKEMLAKRIQEEGLRTYLFTYAPHYRTLSLSLLAKTFSLPLRSVTSIVSKMIWNEELQAALDQSAGVVVFNRVEIARTQQLALTLADKVNAMVEQNEKALDQKLGVSTGWNERADGGKGDKRGEQTQERSRRGDRTRGGTRGQCCFVLCNFILRADENGCRWCAGWPWGTFRTGSWVTDGWQHAKEPVRDRWPYHDRSRLSYGYMYIASAIRCLVLYCCIASIHTVMSYMNIFLTRRCLPCSRRPRHHPRQNLGLLTSRARSSLRSRASRSLRSLSANMNE